MKKHVVHYILLTIAAFYVVQMINTLGQESIRFQALHPDEKWKNINLQSFKRNLHEHQTHSLRLYQGTGTNFCGFAAVTYHLIKYHPKEYERMITELYQNGKTRTPSGRLLKPSKPILEYAGALKGKGRLDLNHADQLWFLTLADQYKGYVNVFNWSYSYGDESTTWASTNLGKFNTLWSTLTGKEVQSRGSDLIRPSIPDFYAYLKDLQHDHSIMLYLNNTVLNKRNFSSITFPIPTHFVELYDLYPIDDYYVLEYWDYGFKTKEIIEKSKFNSLVYGISYAKKSTL